MTTFCNRCLDLLVKNPNVISRDYSKCIGVHFIRLFPSIVVLHRNDYRPPPPYREETKAASSGFAWHTDRRPVGWNRYEWGKRGKLVVCRNNCHHSADRLRHNRDGRASVIITKVARSEENGHAAKMTRMMKMG